MGCWASKKDLPNEEDNIDSSSAELKNEQKSNNVREDSGQYSWSKRDRTDLSRYIIENVHGGVALRRQHEIAGQGIIIQNCNRAVLVLLDYSATVLIDDCIDCTIFVAPVSGSVALRNCINCRIMSASQQFRTRDCINLDCYIYCSTQPVIESSRRLRFASFSADFQDLDRLFVLTNLNVFDNKWHQVYDFCADEQYEKHYTIVIESNHNEIIDQLFEPLVGALKDEQINFCLKSKVVPFTVGVKQIDMLNIMNGNICDLFLLFIALIDLSSEQVNIYQKRLAESHLLPHNHLIPLLSQCFEGSSLSYKRLKQLFPDGYEAQKIIAILYRHSNHNFDLVHDHADLLPIDVQNANLENVQVKSFDITNGSDEFSKFLTMFDYYK